MEEKDLRIKKTVKNAAILILLVVTAVLVASIGLDIFNSTLIRKPSAVSEMPQPSDAEAPAKGMEHYREPLRALLSNKGAFDAAAAGEKSVTGKEPADLSRITLLGTFIGDSLSAAMVRDGDEEKTVIEGDSVAGMRVLRIEKDRMIVSTGSREHTVRMLYGEKPPAPPEKNVAREDGGSSSGASPGTVRREVSRREFAALLDPPDRIARDVALAPVSRDGRPYGIQMTYVKPESFMQKMGFQPGDILVNVNNKPLQVPEDGLMAYQMLKNEDKVDFRVDRNGRFFQLQIIFN